MLPTRANRRRSAEEVGLALPALPGVVDDAATPADVSGGGVTRGDLGGASVAHIA